MSPLPFEVGGGVEVKVDGQSVGTRGAHVREHIVVVVRHECKVLPRPLTPSRAHIDVKAGVKPKPFLR